MMARTSSTIMQRLVENRTTHVGVTEATKFVFVYQWVNRFEKRR